MIRHIPGAADDLLGTPVAGSFEHRGSHQEAAIGAVGVPDLVNMLPYLIVRRGLKSVQPLSDRGQVFRMDQAGQGITGHGMELGQAVAEDGVQAAVDVNGAPLLQVEDEQHVRRGGGDPFQERLGAEHRRFCIPPDAGQVEVGGDARKQVARTERFDEVVIRALLQSLHARFFARASGEQNDRNGLERRICTQGSDQTCAVKLWHHDVAQDQIRGRRRISARAARPSATATTSYRSRNNRRM